MSVTTGGSPMQLLQTTVSRMWPIAAAAVISLALFWAVLFGAQQLTPWLLTPAADPRSAFSMLIFEGTFFAAYTPSMALARRRQKRRQAQRKPPRRDW